MRRVHVADDVHKQHTRMFSPDPAIGWPFAVAALERLNPWAVLALRLGTLALLQECARAMAQSRARRSLLVRAKELVQVLEVLPWEED
jgi:hypothetical protein